MPMPLVPKSAKAVDLTATTFDGTSFYPHVCELAEGHFACMYEASEHLTGALLYRITHHGHLLKMNAERCRLKDIEVCEAVGVTAYMPKPDRSTTRRNGHYLKSDFHYEAATDTYRCPSGERLVPLYRDSVGKTRSGTWVVSYLTRVVLPASDTVQCSADGLGQSDIEEVTKRPSCDANRAHNCRPQF